MTVKTGEKKAKAHMRMWFLYVISGGFAVGGPTNRGHKNYLKELGQVLSTNRAEADPFPKVVVNELDRKLRTPHDDLLVVEMKLTKLRVRSMLIYTGSSMNIISADFIVELTRPAIESVKDPAEGRKHWMLMVDGSSTINGCGAGIICQSPEGDKFEYILRFEFQVSNNKE